MIKRLKVRNFKSIEKLDLLLDPVTVLVGRSGAGKSNIVQALRFVRNVLLGGVESAANYEGGWERIVPVGDTRPVILIEITFSLPGDKKDYTYAMSFGCGAGNKFPGPVSLMSESLALGGELVYSRKCENNQWRWEKAPEVATQPNQTSSPVINNLPSLQVVVFAYAGLASGTGFYHFPASTLSENISVDAKAPFLAGFPGLSDNAHNYLKVIGLITQDFHHPDRRMNLLASLQEVDPAIASIELDSLTEPRRAIVGHKIDGRIFDLNLQQESDGLRRFYAHLLALYQAPPKLTLIFEEPENAIYPGALSLLADEFNAAPRENRGQVIITTHNPMLLDSFDVDHVRVVEMRDGKTLAGPVSKEQTAAVKERLLTTGELLTIDRPRLDEPQMTGQSA